MSTAALNPALILRIKEERNQFIVENIISLLISCVMLMLMSNAHEAAMK